MHKTKHLKDKSITINTPERQEYQTKTKALN